MIFGLLFPLFMFISFYIGRNIDIKEFFPGFVAMTLFFTASSVGPLITPWEKQARTYERLLSYPVTVTTILLGDMVASAIFGLGITAVVFSIGVAGLGVPVSSLGVLIGTMVAGCVCFASLGVLLASPSSRSPPNNMILSKLAWTYLWPLTYLVDASNAALGRTSVLNPFYDILALCAISIVFLVAARAIQSRMIIKGL